LHNLLVVHNTLGVQRETLAGRLRWARETAGLKTRELAAASSVSDGYPSAIECEQFKKPSAEALKKLSDALGVTFDWLCFGTGRKPSVSALKRRGKTIKSAQAKAA